MNSQSNSLEMVELNWPCSRNAPLRVFMSWELCDLCQQIERAMSVLPIFDPKELTMMQRCWLKVCSSYSPNAKVDTMFWLEGFLIGFCQISNELGEVWLFVTVLDERTVKAPRKPRKKRAP